MSMKYRGMFKVASRKPGQISYLAPAGRWSLKGGLQWWRAHHAQTFDPGEERVVDPPDAGALLDPIERLA